MKGDGEFIDKGGQPRDFFTCAEGQTVIQVPIERGAEALLNLGQCSRTSGRCPRSVNVDYQGQQALPATVLHLSRQCSLTQATFFYNNSKVCSGNGRVFILVHVQC